MAANVHSISEHAMKRTFRNQADKLEYDYVQSLKAELSKAYKLPSSDGIERHARILHRGEQLFYSEAKRAVIMQISIPGAYADLKSLRKWDDGSKISEAEREQMFSYLDAFFRAEVGAPLKRS
jgi:SOS-response transcriptional repressor LexA